MKRLPLLLAAASLAALTVSARAQDNLPPIQKVAVVGDHLAVNGQPFFPLMSWAQRPTRYPKLHDLGFNVHAGGDADPAKAADAGDYAVTTFMPADIHNDHILAWLQGDEPDLVKNKKQTPHQPQLSPAALLEKYQHIKSADDSRPVFVTFTDSFMKPGSSFSEEQRAELYPAYVKAADVVGFDVYPIYGSGYAGHLNDVGDGVAELRRLAGPNRPVYAWIETCKGSQWMSYDKQPDVLPIDTRNEVWQAIINGAAGIGYFTHAWKPKFTEFAPTEEMQNELKRLNNQITRFSSAILAPGAKGTITMTLGDNLECQFKATELAGDVYIFALNRDLDVDVAKARQFDPIHPRGGKGTFTVTNLKPGTTIEVIDENRSITASQNSFTDSFAPLAEHIYRFHR